MEFQSSPAPPFSEEHFRRLYDDSIGEALAVARGVCGNEEDAKEACQDAFVAVYRYWQQGRLREPPRRLLFRVVQRSAIDALRARLRRERRAGLADTVAVQRATIAGPLDRALHRLRPNDAALLVLQAVVGMTYEELANVERTSLGAIKSRLFRARRELARRYEEEGGER